VHKPSVSCKKDTEVLIKTAFLLQNIHTALELTWPPIHWILAVLSQW